MKVTTMEQAIKLMNKEVNKMQVVFIDYDEALDLVDRIAERAKFFDHVMVPLEKKAMAQLLSDVGVKVSDLINVDNLADNYAINAELVGPDDVDSYDKSSLDDALFTWQEQGKTYYCIQW